MKALLALVVGTVPLLSGGVALAQGGGMMSGDGWGGGWMGGYGGMVEGAEVHQRQCLLRWLGQ